MKGITIVLLLWLIVGLLAAAEPAQTPPESIRMIHRFVFAAYTDLAARIARGDVTLNIKLFKEGRLSVEVVSTNFSAPAAASTLMTALVQLDGNQHIISWAANGPALEEAANLRLVETIRNNPSWTDGQASAWLMAQRRTVTVSELLTRLSSPSAASFNAFLGQQVVVGMPELSWRAGPAKLSGMAPPFTARPVWTVHVDARLAGQVARYRLEFEPFAGHLVRIVRD